jgi:glycosyltransferase 2 family protein
MPIYLSKKISKYNILIKACISLLFIYILFSKFIQASSFELVRHIGPGTLSICFGLSFLSLVFKSMRWKTMIEMMGGKINFLNLVELYLIGFYYGSISPGRAGEFVKGSRLSNNGLQTKNGLVSILYERFYDIATPTAFMSIYYTIYVSLHKEAPAILLLLGTYSISIVLWIGMIHAFQLFKKRIQFLKNVDDVCLIPSMRYTFTPAMASILNWACIGLSAFVLLNSFDVGIDFPHVMFAVCIAMLSLLIPVTINGWGIREAAFVWALRPFAEPSQAIIFSIAFSLIGTYSLALLGLMCEMRGKGEDGSLQGKARS